jgi:hypothetical protein
VTRQYRDQEIEIMVDTPAAALDYPYSFELDGIAINNVRLVGTISIGSGPGQVTLAKALGDRFFADWMNSRLRKNAGLIRYDDRGNEVTRYKIEGAQPSSLESDENEEFLTLDCEDVSTA